jgi:hypothetical protein
MLSKMGLTHPPELAAIARKLQRNGESVEMLSFKYALYLVISLP